jgi:hypothetical protein
MSFQVTEEDITKFIEAWKADFDEVLSREEAKAQIDRLMSFFGIMAQEFHKAPPVEKRQDETDDDLPAQAALF